MATPLSASGNAAPSASSPSSGGEGLNIDSIKNELQRLSAANQELLQSFSGRPRDAISRASSRTSVADSSDRLIQENAGLKRLVDDLKGQLANQTPDAWTQQQQEFEKLLDEKSEIIRTLNHKIQTLTETGELGSREHDQEKLEAWAAELRERDEQLRADEEAMQMQVREMEMRMSKERAELARQRSQLERLHSDMEREVEMASRDSGLRDRLKNLQRSGDSRPRPSTQPTLDPNASQVDAAPLTESRGVLRRLFGG